MTMYIGGIISWTQCITARAQVTSLFWIPCFDE